MLEPFITVMITASLMLLSHHKQITSVHAINIVPGNVLGYRGCVFFVMKRAATQKYAQMRARASVAIQARKHDTRTLARVQSGFPLMRIIDLMLHISRH